MDKNIEQSLLEVGRPLSTGQKEKISGKTRGNRRPATTPEFSNGVNRREFLGLVAGSTIAERTEEYLKTARTDSPNWPVKS